MKSEANNLQRFAFQRASNALALGFGLALLLSPRLVPPCGHATEIGAKASVAMRCHWTFQIESLLSVAVIVVAGALWVIRHAEARRVLGGVLVLFGLLVVAVTQSWVVGLCGNAAMACHVTAHWLWLWAVLLIALGGFVVVSAQSGAKQVVARDPWEAPGSPGKAA